MKYYFIVKTENEKLKKVYRINYLKLSFIIEKRIKKILCRKKFSIMTRTTISIKRIRFSKLNIDKVRKTSVHARQYIIYSMRNTTASS